MTLLSSRLRIGYYLFVNIPAIDKLKIPVGSTNLLQALLDNLSRPKREAVRYKVQGQWRSVTWGEIMDRTRALAEGLVDAGVRPNDRVCIWAQTSWEWCLADLAILAAGAVSVPIYASNTAREVEHIINDCEAKIVVFDHDQPEGNALGRWSQLKEIRLRVPSVVRFVSFNIPTALECQLVSLEDLEAQGRSMLEKKPAQHARAMEERARHITGDDLSCILYTSGTAGNPKGVMLSHANWLAQTYATVRAPVLVADDLALLFLPLAHSFARLVEMCWISQGIRIAFAESIEKVVSNAAEVKPTILPSVPRFYEKAFNQVMIDGMSKTGLEGVLFRWAMRLFEGHVGMREQGRESRSVQWFLAKRLVFSKIAKKIERKFGGDLRLFVSGGASLSRKVGYFFEACGIHIAEGYGLTETCAPTHVNRLGSLGVGTVGYPMPGIECKLAEDGEILVRGPQVMQGYYKLPQETAKAFDPQGWFYTGDIGELDSLGRLRVTDRKKDLIKTSGGKYVAPQEVENALKLDSLIGQALVHGEGRKFVSALLTISPDDADSWAQKNQVEYESMAELCSHPRFVERLQFTIDSVNSGLPPHATIKKFAILDGEWAQESGELTPTLKVKRRVIEQRYKEVLENFYLDDTNNGYEQWLG